MTNMQPDAIGDSDESDNTFHFSSLNYILVAPLNVPATLMVKWEIGQKPGALQGGRKMLNFILEA